jgi:hypothetical protein
MEQLVRTLHQSAACLSGQQMAPTNMQRSGSYQCRFYTEQMSPQLLEPQQQLLLQSV